MKKLLTVLKFFFLVILIILTTFFASGQIQSQELSAKGNLKLKTLSHVNIAVLVDNESSNSSMLSEWGLSFFIDTGQYRILFDTGQSGEVLLENARILNIDLTNIDAIVISHGHGDHTGGLNKVLNLCGYIDIFIHPEAFITKYWKDGSKSTMPLSYQQLQQKTRKFVETKEPTLICDGVMVTGQIPRVNNFEDTGIKGHAFLDSSLKIPDLVLNDQAIFFRVPEGVVILLGCGHAGIVNTMQYVCELLGEKEIYAVIGGTHLIRASPERIQKTIDALKKYSVKKIMLSHCTGLKVYSQLKKAFPNRCSWPGSGTRIEFGKETGNNLK